MSKKNKFIWKVKKNNDDKWEQKFGYFHGNLSACCSDLKLEYEKKYEESKIPSKFSIVTYNILGFLKKKSDNYNFGKKLLRKRMKEICNILKTFYPDLVCFQEMTNKSLNYLLKYGMEEMYHYRYEENFDTEKNKIERGRELDGFLFSKYPISGIQIYSITGNLGYTNSLMIIEFSNIVIFNCHFQAGSKFSPGQADYWHHYSRCRKEQITAIQNLLRNYKKPVILTGDFNCDLDGNINDWPELKELKNLNMKDAWIENNILNSDGTTENTDINHMRWNLKFQHKKFRYDAFLYQDSINSKNIHVIGKDPIVLNKKDSKKFIEYYVPEKHKKDIVYYDQNILALWPSDHFGVFVCFEI